MQPIRTIRTIRAIRTSAAFCLALMACAAAARAAPAPTIHQVTASEAGLRVNSYLVEGEHGVVAIDSALTISDARALRKQADALGKPLLAILITHGHPDHYNGGYLVKYRQEVDQLRAGGSKLSEAQKQTLVDHMTAAYPGAANAFMIGLSADTVAAELAHRR